MSPLSHTHTLVLVRSLCLLSVFCYAAFIYLWALKYISFQLLCVVGRIRRGRRRAPCRQQTALSCMLLCAGSCSRRRRKKGSTTVSTHPSLGTLLNPVVYIWVQGCRQGCRHGDTSAFMSFHETGLRAVHTIQFVTMISLSQQMGCVGFNVSVHIMRL